MEDQRPVTFPKRIGRTSDGQEDSGGDEELKLPVNRELGFSVEFEKERNDFASRIALQNEQSSFRGAEEEDEFALQTWPPRLFRIQFLYAAKFLKKLWLSRTCMNSYFLLLTSKKKLISFNLVFQIDIIFVSYIFSTRA